MLKVSWVDVSSIQEPLALRIWGGRGAVRLIDEQPALGAMLLERLDHRQSLEHVPESEATTVAGTLLRRLVVNSDLHYGSVLRGEREPWLVIDPKIIAGDVEYGIAQLLWNRFSELRTSADFERRLAMLAAAGSLDTSRARQWALVRVVDYWLWAISLGLTEDRKKCRLLVEWLQ